MKPSRFSSALRGHPLLPCLVALPLMGPIASAQDKDVKVTFNEHVAPIIFNNCTSCHREGEAAPFSLSNYKEVRKRGRTIAEVTQDRFMPPWHAEPADVKYRDERRLSDPQIATIRSWVTSGMVEGAPDKLPPLPKFESGWKRGKPDLVVEMPVAFEVPADGPDLFRNFVVPLGLKEDRWIRAMEFRPSTPGVHHSLFGLDRSGEAQKRDAETPEPGFDAMGAELLPSAYIGGWAVGGQGVSYPPEMAIRVRAGESVVLSTHFHPIGKPVKEKSRLALYFSKEPPTREMHQIELPPIFGSLSQIVIPAGEKAYELKDRFTLPIAVDAFAVSAHAHMLGHRMELTATLPEGKTIQLLKINNWDFNWQEQYSFKESVPLPKGTVLDAKIVWNNSAENPSNPNDPPKLVRWGRQSYDEMGTVTLMVSPGKGEESQALTNALRGHYQKVSMKWAREVGFKRNKQDPIYRLLVEQFDKNKNGELELREWGAVNRFMRSRGY